MAVESFTLSIGKFVAATKLRETLVMRKIALDMLARIIERTPVLTGRLKANWHISTNTPQDIIFDETDKDGMATYAKAVSELEGAGGLLSEFGVKKIFILNNLEYAIPIEYGHSKEKAPAGMVRITVQEFEEYLKKAVASIKAAA